MDLKLESRNTVWQDGRVCLRYIDSILIKISVACCLLDLGGHDQIPFEYPSHLLCQQRLSDDYLGQVTPCFHVLVTIDTKFRSLSRWREKSMTLCSRFLLLLGVNISLRRIDFEDKNGE